MSPRPNVSDERKSQIMTAAEGVFTLKGFEDARMEDIAAETGLSKGTLYLYFKSKDELILAILDRLFQREFRQLQALAQAEDSASAAIQKLIDLVTQDISRLLPLVPIIYNFLALAFRNQQVQHVLKEYIQRYIAILVQLIQRGIDTGEFRSVDAREAAITAGAIIEGTILLWAYDHDSIHPAHHIRSGMKLLLESLQVCK